MTTVFRGRARRHRRRGRAVATSRSRAFESSWTAMPASCRGIGVLDLGGGRGGLTRASPTPEPRARARARCGRARQLETRSARDPSVEVVEGDATLVPLPVEPFAVVANLPFAAGTAILRRLLGDPRVPLRQLDASWSGGSPRSARPSGASTQLGCAWGAWSS